MNHTAKIVYRMLSKLRGILGTRYLICSRPNWHGVPGISETVSPLFLDPKCPYGCGTLGLLTASTSPHMIHSNKINEDGIRMLLLIVG